MESSGDYYNGNASCSGCSGRPTSQPRLDMEDFRRFHDSGLKSDKEQVSEGATASTVVHTVVVCNINDDTEASISDEVSFQLWLDRNMRRIGIDTPCSHYVMDVYLTDEEDSANSDKVIFRGKSCCFAIQATTCNDGGTTLHKISLQRREMKDDDDSNSATRYSGRVINSPRALAEAAYRVKCQLSGGRDGSSNTQQQFRQVFLHNIEPHFEKSTAEDEIPENVIRVNAARGGQFECLPKPDSWNLGLFQLWVQALARVNLIPDELDKPIQFDIFTPGPSDLSSDTVILMCCGGIFDVEAVSVNVGGLEEEFRLSVRPHIADVVSISRGTCIRTTRMLLTVAYTIACTLNERPSPTAARGVPMLSSALSASKLSGGGKKWLAFQELFLQEIGITTEEDRGISGDDEVDKGAYSYCSIM